jgi:hypothetical protein
MYNQQNLGDCFLIQFKVDSDEAFLLLDFGSYLGTNEAREEEIAANIVQTVKNKPLTIALTHQHKDHLSGFITAFETLKNLDKVQQCWLSFLDNPNSKEGNLIREATEKYWKENEKNKERVRRLSNKIEFTNKYAVDKMLKQKERFDLFAESLYAEKQNGGQAITNLKELAKNKVNYLVPGNVFDFPGLPPNTIKVYVLGPPIEKSLLTKLNPNKDEEVHGLSAGKDLMHIDLGTNMMVDALNGLTGENNLGQGEYIKQDYFPFNKKFTYPLNDIEKKHPLEEVYTNPDNDWRRIDEEWLSEIGRLTLYMDRLTNNTSLVLAFELVETRKVLLFVGDAQIGNWKSWFDLKFKDSKKDEEIKTEDLLSRTVLYKAGHHSSHNATLLQALDLMNEEELVIMVPVNGDISKKMGFAMLKPGMLMGYNRKSQGRVLRSDTIFHSQEASTKYKYHFSKTPEEFRGKLTIGKDNAGKHLYIQYKVE